MKLKKLLKVFVAIIKPAENNKIVVKCSALDFVFHSMLDVRCSMLDVHFFKRIPAS